MDDPILCRDGSNSNVGSVLSPDNGSHMETVEMWNEEVSEGGTKAPIQTTNREVVVGKTESLEISLNVTPKSPSS
jgi:hypothetical protein